MLQTIALQSKCRDRKYIIGHTLGIHLAESTVRNSMHYRVFALEGAAAAEIHQTHQVAAAAAGVQFGTVVASAATPLTILACNAALGTCSAACAATALIAPIP